MSGRKKLTLKELREQHAAEIDPTDSQQRTRYRRTLDNLYRCGLKLEEPGISDVARGSAVKAAIDYCDRTGGKAVTPLDVTGTVTHKSTEQHVESILENLSRLKGETKPGSLKVN
ncbi:MAG TPA: hypothetical protein VK466_03140 [Terriglobales bacterium]|nr:hypothetical protein [Terriglobales bacterium]